MEKASPVRTRLGLVAVLAGCNQVYGIGGALDQVDADLMRPDRDRDGVPDDVDNCPDIMNADQLDVDGDAVGDACDDCPLVASSQGVDSDGDKVGDACDPHVTTPGDCLVIVERFVDPALFTQHWNIVAPTGTSPSVTPYERGVHVVSDPSNQRVGLLLLDESGKRYAGRYDVQILARGTAVTGGLAVTTGVDDPIVHRGVFCSAGSTSTMLGLAMGNDLASTAISLIPTEQAGDAIRILFEDTANDGVMTCRIDAGASVAADQFTIASLTTVGASGVIIYNNPIDVTAYALYRPMSPCPTPLLR